MRKTEIYTMGSPYREDLRITGYTFGHGKKAACIVGSIRGNEIQQLYICSQLIRKLNEEDHVAIIMVSHDIMNILSQAKTILHLKQQPLFYGTVSDYKKSEVSMRFLGGEENSGND